MDRTSEERFLGGIAHIAAVLFSWLGLVALLIIYFAYKPKSAFVAAHAKQALGLWVVRYLVQVALGLLLIPFVGGAMLGGVFGSPRMFGMMGFGMASLWGLLTVGLFLAFLVLAIIAAIRGFQGEEYRYPLFGDFVARLGE